MEVYKAESRHIMEIMRRAGGDLEPMSIDEAYLDLSAVIRAQVASAAEASRIRENEVSQEVQDRALRAALPVARELKRAIREERELTATIGIASNKLLAKLASDFRKPDGLTLIPESEKVQFLRPLPARALHGVGRVTEQALSTAGIHTVGDLQDYPGDLRSLVGSFAEQLKRFSMGVDDRPLELDDTIKSISSEETFLRDTADRVVLRTSLRTQAADVASKLERRRLAARTVQVKLRYGDFTTLTRQISLQEPVTTASEIYRTACYLLGRQKLVSRPLRLLGVGVSNVDLPRARQLHLW
jgi:DNA polymerase-4